MVSHDELVALARKAQESAYAPYSGFPVGAALLASDGSVFTGVNVENASYGLSVCAERNAVARAVSEGARDFTAIAIVTNSEEPTMPCGVCRQVLWEFAHDLEVIVEGSGGRRIETTIRDLFPMPFTSIDE
jgi:cytidine deaminase